MDDQTQPTTPQEEPSPREVLEGAIVHEEQSFALRFLLLLGVLLAVLILLFYVLPGSPQNDAPTVSAQEDAIATTSISSSQQVVSSAFPQVELEAKAAYVMDLDSGELYFSKNGTSQLPLASLTKLMTILVAAELFDASDALTVTAGDLQGDLGTGLIPDESWLSRDLFTYTLTQSSNGGARAIASAAGALPRASSDDYLSAEKEFVAKMNEKAEVLDLSQTYFINETGLDETDRTGGGYGSARDVAYLMGEMISRHPEIIEGTRHEAVALSTIENQSHVAINTNQSIGNVPGLIGSKTGYTDLAGGNLAIAFDRGVGKPVIVVVLGSSKEGRFSDVQTLVDATFTYLGMRE
jgi:D-alanyl-D-alanine carboxypeptidase (penicillin-binding protein 5/6)